MGFIFESEIESIINSVRARTIGEDESITLKRVLHSEIHPAVKAYFKAEVEKHLKQERELELRSKKFPYSHAEVLSLQQQVDLLLQQHYEFDKHEFESLLDESVHFQFNYLCRPQWTLLNFVFGGQSKVSTTTVERKLAYCVDYLYFGDLLKRYFVDRGLAEISYEEFKRLLKSIDDEVVARHSSNELARLMKAMVSFVDAGELRAGEGAEAAPLPVNAAIVFFEDKGMDDIMSRLERERDTNGVNRLTLADLANVIERVRTGNEDAVAPGVSPLETTPSSANRSDGELPQATGVRYPDATTEGARPLETGPESPRALDEQAEHANAAQDESLPSLHDIFSKEEKRHFVRKIFAKDESMFDETIRILDGLSSWDEAAHRIDELYLARNVDPFSPEAVLFTERVYTRYRR